MKLIFHDGEVKVLGTNVQMQMCLERAKKSEAGVVSKPSSLSKARIVWVHRIKQIQSRTS
jgi:hypothetical protein